MLNRICALSLFFLNMLPLAHADSVALQACLSRSDGMERTKCYVEELGRQKQQQRRLLLSLEKKFSGCTISWSGYDAKRAIKELGAAQTNWAIFVEHDCNYAVETFGQGTDRNVAGAQCQMRHYQTRNAELDKRVIEVQEVKKMLKDSGKYFLQCPEE